MIKKIEYASKKWGFFGATARYLLWKSEVKKFINTRSIQSEKYQIKRMLKAFDQIHANVRCDHSPYMFVIIAKYILELDIEGPIVECGCDKGGGSAKLSIIARATNRHLFICDSFAGLPEPLPEDKEVILGDRKNHLGLDFRKGSFFGTLEEVKDNITNYGCIDVCTFISGFFKDSLKNLDINPACVIIDVDLVSSARDCLRYLWPRTLENGLWFTHEAKFVNYIEGILNPDWWKTNLNEIPPIIFGAGSGLSDSANSLAYFIKKQPVFHYNKR